MKSARIAVVVPVYNAREYLPLCLTSLAAQSFSGFCAILVDDGSTDGSAEICDRWAARDDRFTVLHLPNGGPAAARAAGVQAANCEYISFATPMICCTRLSWKRCCRRPRPPCFP